MIFLALLSALGDATADDLMAEDLSIINESDPVAWCNKGHDLYSLGNYDEAIQAFDKAIQINPETAYAWIGKGVMFGIRGKYDEAI
jgi:tetratricopeptide (TPR) repeat protein